MLQDLPPFLSCYLCGSCWKQFAEADLMSSPIPSLKHQLSFDVTLSATLQVYVASNLFVFIESM